MLGKVRYPNTDMVGISCVQLNSKCVLEAYFTFHIWAFPKKYLPVFIPLQTRGGSTAAQPTAEDRAKAEELKTEGDNVCNVVGITKSLAITSTVQPQCFVPCEKVLIK